jgi:hypothetical protein
MQACADIDEGTAGGAGGNAQHFAHINSAVGIGLAIGSGFGGQLSYASASGLASVAYVVAATMVLIGLPAVQSSSRTARKAAPQQTSRGSRARKADGSASPAPEARTTLSMGVLAVMVVMRLLFSSCATAQRETFALAVKDRMNMSEGWIGAFLSYKGVVAMLANSVGLVPLLASKRWPSHVVLLAATGGLATSYSLSAMALHTSSSALLAVTQMPLTVTTNVCRTLLQVRASHPIAADLPACLPLSSAPCSPLSSIPPRRLPAVHLRQTDAANNDCCCCCCHRRRRRLSVCYTRRRYRSRLSHPTSEVRFLVGLVRWMRVQKYSLRSAHRGCCISQARLRRC